MASDSIKLVDFDREQPKPIEFPNGHTYQVRPLDAIGYELCEEVYRTQDKAKVAELLRRILPGVTDADLGLLTYDRTVGIILHARNQLDMVLGELKKNGTASPAVTPTAPSPPRSKRKTRPAP